MKCQKCGRKIKIQGLGGGTKGKIVVATPQTMRNIALRCRKCDFITCMRCSLQEIFDVRVGAVVSRPTCPSCGGAGGNGPILFVEWLELKG